MILTINVCDICGNEAEIKKGDTQLEFHFKTALLSASRLDSSYYNNKLISGTFCGKECLLEYLRNYFNEKKKEE